MSVPTGRAAKVQVESPRPGQRELLGDRGQFRTLRDRRVLRRVLRRVSFASTAARTTGHLDESGADIFFPREAAAPVKTAVVPWRPTDWTLKHHGSRRSVRVSTTSSSWCSTSPSIVSAEKRRARAGKSR